MTDALTLASWLNTISEGMAFAHAVDQRMSLTQGEKEMFATKLAEAAAALRSLHAENERYRSPDEATVERVAIEISERTFATCNPDEPQVWSELSEIDRGTFRRTARAAIAALANPLSHKE